MGSQSLGFVTPFCHPGHCLLGLYMRREGGKEGAPPRLVHSRHGGGWRQRWEVEASTARARNQDGATALGRAWARGQSDSFADSFEQRDFNAVVFEVFLVRRGVDMDEHDARGGRPNKSPVMRCVQSSVPLLLFCRHVKREWGGWVGEGISCGFAGEGGREVDDAERAVRSANECRRRSPRLRVQGSPLFHSTRLCVRVCACACAHACARELLLSSGYSVSHGMI